MIKSALLSVSFLLLMLTACGDNIHPEIDSDGGDDGECFDCPPDLGPDAGTPTPDSGGTDADTGGGTDAGTDGGTGGGSDGGTGGSCGTCPEGQVCVDGACVCDHAGDPADGGCAPDEVLLCHVPPGSPDASHGICVGPSAVQAHVAHGDALGACP
ncbi:MAG TPA: hypothetical protein VL283_01280 [Candidatus Baltobacteraceae bacterium]|nr:hypothetical protein [Candidatus Baltobacteraceae bacterium]